MADVTIKLEPPLSFIQAQSGRFRSALEDFSPLWERFEKTMESIETERFNSRGYGEWPELAASTIAQKAAHGFPLDPLVRTGALQASLTDPRQAAEKGPQQFVWGTTLPYAHWHQDGGTISGRPPQRTILEIRTEDRRRIEADQASWLNEVAALTWGRI